MEKHFADECHSNSQIIVGGVARSPEDVKSYASCSLLAATMTCDDKDQSAAQTSKGAIEACVEWLMVNEFISIQKDGEGIYISYFVPVESQTLCNDSD